MNCRYIFADGVNENTQSWTAAHNRLDLPLRCGSSLDSVRSGWLITVLLARHHANESARIDVLLFLLSGLRLHPQSHITAGLLPYPTLLQALVTRIEY